MARAQHIGILHARLVVRRFEGSGLVDDHDGDHVLQANVRHLAVVHRVGPAGGHTHDHLFYLVRLEQEFFQDQLQGIHGRLDRAAGRPAFERGHGDFIALAQAIDHFGWIAFRIVGQHEIVRAGHNIIYGRPAKIYHQRGGHAIAGGAASENKTFFDVIGISSPGCDAGPALLCRVIQKPAHLRRTVIAQPAAAAAPNVPTRECACP